MTFFIKIYLFIKILFLSHKTIVNIHYETIFIVAVKEISLVELFFNLHDNKLI
jgi:hypothetical protein